MWFFPLLQHKICSLTILFCEGLIFVSRSNLSDGPIPMSLCDKGRWVFKWLSLCAFNDGEMQTKSVKCFISCKFIHAIENHDHDHDQFRLFNFLAIVKLHIERWYFVCKANDLVCVCVCVLTSGDIKREKIARKWEETHTHTHIRHTPYHVKVRMFTVECIIWHQKQKEKNQQQTTTL